MKLIVVTAAMLSAALLAGCGPDKRQESAAAKTWFIVNRADTACNEVPDGPAGKLEEFVGFADRPRTVDFRDLDGNIYKVEVIVSAGDGINDRVWTYYRKQDRCENEMVNATRNLANRYR